MSLPRFGGVQRIVVRIGGAKIIYCPTLLPSKRNTTITFYVGDFIRVLSSQIFSTIRSPHGNAHIL